MKPSTVAFALLLAAEFFSAHIAQAQSILPRATFREELGRFQGDVGPILDLYLPESDTYTASRQVGAHTGRSSSFVQIRSLNQPSFAGPALNIFGSAFNAGTTDPNLATHLFAGGASARAEVEYYFRVITSPSVQSVPLLMPVSFSFDVDRDGSFATASVMWSVQVQRVFNRNTFVAFDSGGTNIGPPVNPLLSVSEGETRVLSFSAFTASSPLEGEYYKVSLNLRGSAGWNRPLAESFGQAGLPATSSFTASLDPLPHVDPNFAGADQVRLEFSSNLFATAVPEPSALAFFSVGLPLMGLWWRRRTRA